MLLKQMQYFISVVRCQSFTEAAEECYISQSAISQQIKALEKELGVSLLKREGRSFSLTPAGEYFYRHGQVLLDDIEHFKNEVIRRGEDEEVNLVIGYPKNFSSVELHEAITQFVHLYPEVNISIVSGTHEELFNLLVDGHIDMKISEQRRAFNDDYYNYELKYSEGYIEMSLQNPLATLDKIDIDDLHKLTCILVVSTGYEESERDFYEKTLGLSHRFLFTDSLEQARLMVAGNRGFLPVDVIGRLQEPMSGITRIPLYHHEKPLQRKYFACWSKEKTNYYIEEFADILRQLLNQ